MATANPFDLLGDIDNDDPSQLIASAQQLQLKAQAQAATLTKKDPAGLQPKQAKLPSKPLPPAQAVRESRSEAGRGGRGLGRGGRGRGGFSRDYGNNDNAFSNSIAPGSQGAPDEGEGGKPSERRPFSGPRAPYRGGGRRGGFSDGEVRDGERPRRTFDRRSGTGRGGDIKREGSGRGNWGSQNDEVTMIAEEEADQTEKNPGAEKPSGAEDTTDGNKETPVVETEEKEPEEKEMTLDEYEKLLEEKRKALQALRAEERKVEIDKELESMQQLSNKKDNDTIFIKLGAGKDKKKEFEKDEKAKKSVSINEFLKPSEGERYYSPGGRGRGRGRGSRGGFGGGNMMPYSSASAPSIEDPGQFPTLGAK